MALAHLSGNRLRRVQGLRHAQLALKGVIGAITRGAVGVVLIFQRIRPPNQILDCRAGLVMAVITVGPRRQKVV